MASGGTPPEGPGPGTPLAARHSRWIGQQYADITKLREHAARHDRSAARAQQRAARLNTRIEKLRHQATLLREKGQKVLAEIPEIEQQIKQHDRDINASTNLRNPPGTPPGQSRPVALTSDVTSLHYRVRKLQQKVVDKQQKARHLELRAAQKTQKTAELKVKVDRYTEASRLEEQEANAFRQRADRLQAVSENDVATHLASTATPPTNAPSDEPPRLP
jgi:predicted ribosome quality control (RQC) complex YloA/Tae2 family protein